MMIKSPNKMIAYGFGIIISGCSYVYPIDKHASLNIPLQWEKTRLNDTKAHANLPGYAWWKAFHDPNLEALIRRGLRENNTIGQAEGNLEKARGTLQKIRLSWLPTLNWLGGYSQNPALGAPLLFGAMFPGYFAANFFQKLAAQRSAHIALEATEYALSATKLTLIGQIATSYFTYQAETEQIHLLKQYIADLTTIHHINQADFETGLTSAFAVESSEKTLQYTQATLTQVESNQIKSQHALRYLTNQNPGPIRSNQSFKTMNTTYPDVASLPATVLKDRPDIAFAEAQYRLVTKQRGIVNTTLLPAVQLDTFYGRIDEKTATAQFVSLNDAYATWSINPAVFGEINAMKGKQKAAYHAYVDCVRAALRDVANDYIRHHHANLRYQKTLHAYQAAQRHYALNKALYQRGIVPETRLLLDKIQVDQAALTLNEVKLVQLITLVALYQDLGGGYNAERLN